METPQPTPSLSSRLLSLDALRGFNMFWIIGGDDLVSGVLERTHNPTLRRVSANLTSHVEWTGFHFYDMIFPLFLFIIGVALPFSTAKRVRQGETRQKSLARILKRTLLLFVLGLIYNGLLQFRGVDHLRIMGVLQRLALGYGAAALITMCTRPRQQAAIAVMLLLGYWAVMAWVTVPGVPRGSMTQMGNLANYIDRQVFAPGQLYTPYGDPEGLLSTLPAIATALLGVLAGQWLLSDQKPDRKALGLALAGLACIAIGYLWAPWFPIIKKIWTSSYVLIAGGWSLLLLALFYWLIDVRGYRRWTFFLVVIGVNPLTIYLLQNIVGFDSIASYFVSGISQFLPLWGPVLVAFSVLLAKWLFLLFLYRQKIYLRA